MSNTLIYSILTFFVLHTAFFLLEQVHYKYCVPAGLAGYFTSMFSSNSPPCVALRYVSTGISASIISLISLLGPILISTFLNVRKTNDQNSTQKCA